MIATRFVVASVLLLGAGLVIYSLAYEFPGERERRLIEVTTAQEIAKLRSGETRASINYADTLEAIAEAPALRDSVSEVVFWMADMGDPGMRCLGDFPSIESLFFYSCQDATAISGCIAELPNLESIGFERTDVDSVLLNALIAAPALKEVHFEQIMTAEEIAELKTRRPDLEIEWTPR